MDNPEKLASLGTQDTEQRQRKKTQHRKLNKMSNTHPPKSRGEPRCSRRVSSSCFL